MTTNQGNKAKRQGAGLQRRKIRAPKTFAKVSTAAARTSLNRALIDVEVCKELGAWVNEPPPPETDVMMKELIDAFLKGFEKGKLCAKVQQILENNEQILEDIGSDLSAEDYKELNDATEALWESSVKLGC